MPHFSGILSYILKLVLQKFKGELNLKETFILIKNWLYSLRKHITIVHGGKKRFQCDICDKKFKRQWDLKQHKTLPHAFECNGCDKKFAIKIQLKNHILIVHEGKKPYQCLRCNKKFYKEKFLKRHNSAGSCARNMWLWNRIDSWSEKYQ